MFTGFLKCLAVLDQKHPSAKNSCATRALPRYHICLNEQCDECLLLSDLNFRLFHSILLSWVQISLWMKCWWYCVQNLSNASIVSYHIKNNVEESRIACNAANATKILMRVWVYSILCDSYFLITLEFLYEIDVKYALLFELQVQSLRNYNSDIHYIILQIQLDNNFENMNILFIKLSNVATTLINNYAT